MSISIPQTNGTSVPTASTGLTRNPRNTNTNGASWTNRQVVDLVIIQEKENYPIILKSQLLQHSFESLITK